MGGGSLNSSLQPFSCPASVGEGVVVINNCDCFVLSQHHQEFAPRVNEMREPVSPFRLEPII